MSIILNTDALLAVVASLDRRAARQYQRIVHQVANEMATLITEQLPVDCTPARRIDGKTLVTFGPKNPADPCPEELADFTADGSWADGSARTGAPRS